MQKYPIGLATTVFNEMGHLDAWLESLRKQTRHPDHLVIVDGGSTDGTWQALESALESLPFKTTLLLVNGANIALGRNTAIRSTNCPIVACTDAGTILPPDWFATIVAPLEKDPTVQMVAGGWEFIPEPEGLISRAIIREIELPALDKPFNASGRSVAFRIETWTSIGGYPEWTTNWAEDKWFALEMKRVGANTVYLPKLRVPWRYPTSLSAYYRMCRNYNQGNGEIGRALKLSSFAPLLTVYFILTAISLLSIYNFTLGAILIFFTLSTFFLLPNGLFLGTRIIIKSFKFIATIHGYLKSYTGRSALIDKKKSFQNKIPGLGIISLSKTNSISMLS